MLTAILLMIAFGGGAWAWNGAHEQMQSCTWRVDDPSHLHRCPRSFTKWPQ